MLDLLAPLKAAGLTGVKVLWTFFERRVQPLGARARPLFQYTSVDDPTRSSQDVLEPMEVRSRVWTVIRRVQAPDDLQELDRHEAGLAPYPSARRDRNDPPSVSFALAFDLALAKLLPNLVACFASAAACEDALPATAGGRSAEGRQPSGGGALVSGEPGEEEGQCGPGHGSDEARPRGYALGGD
ncbi:hypothetical protein BAE44_0021374 [Dichanthelium oligosanthes]|uniref:Uncharacterized protein n=1 Tax=Dichanthelium oligosanthes TaxID=888268 RepID=A0A1E5UXM5_9POAL|nr:hypothetical protein BAE44_0021374 [Dichanthelium oligosanthes]